MSRPLRKRKPSPASKKKALIKQCVWCKTLLKAGPKLQEEDKPFCSDRCLAEYRTRGKIVRKELDGQPSVVVGSGVKVEPLIPVPVIPLLPDNPGGLAIDKKHRITVGEFLEGRTEAEMEELAVRLFGKVRPRQWLKPVMVVLSLLLSLIIILWVLAEKEKGDYSSAVLRVKRQADGLRHQLSERIRASVPVDTQGLRIVFPLPGHVQAGRYINIEGSGQDSMSVTLVVNGQIRDYSRIMRGTFIFRRVFLKIGENDFVLKGVDASSRYYESKGQVRCGEIPESPLPVRHIDYSKPQHVVPNQYRQTLNFSRGDERRAWIALTFDAADHAGEASRILDTLQSRQVRATLFLTGRFIQRNSELVLRMASEGHILGNHTESHPHLTTFERDGLQNTLPVITSYKLAQELERVRERYEALGLKPSHFWRAPYGEQNRTINAWAEGIGYKHIGWTAGSGWTTNLDTNDWVVAPGDKGYFTPDEIIKKILHFGYGTAYGLNGGIVLMHLGTLREQGKMADKLGALIDTLRASGYELVTVDKMVARQED